MTDVTHDAVDDGFHEIHLSGKQLFFLFMATVAVSVAIFLIGVFVGRNVRSQQALDHLNDSTTALAAPAPAAPAVTPQNSPAAAPPPAAESVPEAAEPPTPPAEGDELSYKKRLEGPAASETLRSKPAARTQPPAAQPPAAQAPAPQSRAAAAVQDKAPATALGTAQPGTWVIQIHVLRDRNAANTIVRRLVGKGYPAFVVAAGPPTSTYKVQVGRYRDRDEAQKVIERLKKEEQFNPWITR